MIFFSLIIMHEKFSLHTKLSNRSSKKKTTRKEKHFPHRWTRIKKGMKSPPMYLQASNSYFLATFFSTSKSQQSKKDFWFLLLTPLFLSSKLLPVNWFTQKINHTEREHSREMWLAHIHKKKTTFIVCLFRYGTKKRKIVSCEHLKWN